MDWLMLLINVINNEQVAAAFFGAFFAFLFFIVGQLWLETNKERKEIINSLFSIREFVTYQISPIKINQSVIENINSISNPIQIFLNRFELFPIEEKIYVQLYKYKVVESVVMFLVELRVINNGIEILNNNIKELSDFSRIAMVERRENDFRLTIEGNFKNFKERVQKLSELINSMDGKMDQLIAEIEFTLNYEKSYFWIKCYILLRQKFDSNYINNRTKKIAPK